MPFTPFHMGFGLAAKAAAGNRLGLIAFGLSQVLIDIEPGVRMLLGTDELHGWSHTLLGAVAIAALATWWSQWLVLLLAGRWNDEVRHYGQDWLSVPGAFSGPVAALGAFVGTISHLVLDSLMHADMKPLAPFSDANPLLGLVAHDAVYSSMVVLGVIGALLWLVRQWINR
jgi:hypothetical protein